MSDDKIDYYVKNRQIDDMPEGVEEDCDCEECAPGSSAEQRENRELTKIIDSLHEENRKLRYLNERLLKETQGVPCYEGGFIQLIVAIRRTYHGLSLIQARYIQKEVARMAKEMTQ